MKWPSRLVVALVFELQERLVEIVVVRPMPLVPPVEPVRKPSLAVKLVAQLALERPPSLPEQVEAVELEVV